MKKLLAAALSGVLTAGIILGGTGLSTKAAETERWQWNCGGNAPERSGVDGPDTAGL